MIKYDLRSTVNSQDRKVSAIKVKAWRIDDQDLQYQTSCMEKSLPYGTWD